MIRKIILSEGEGTQHPPLFSNKLAALHKHFNDKWAVDLEGVADVSYSVYSRVAELVLKEEKCDAIVPRGYDHNVCPVCESLSVKRSMLAEELAAMTKLGIAGASGASGVAGASTDTQQRPRERREVQAEIDATNKELEAHLALYQKVE